MSKASKKLRFLGLMLHRKRLEDACGVAPNYNALFHFDVVLMPVTMNFVDKQNFFI
jgi:hypothetical protein